MPLRGSDHRRKRQDTVSRDRSHKLLTNNQETILSNRYQRKMCIGFQEIIWCEMCREETPLDINWQGCHIEVCEVDLPTCPEPIIFKSSTCRSCQICLTEADDGGDPDDRYPEPFSHPGFPSDTEPVIHMPRVESFASTTYESVSRIENLAGTADELPSYEDILNQTPLPPSYDLIQLRDAAYNESYIPFVAHTRAMKRHHQLMSVARKNRHLIREFLNQDPHLAAIKILDYATEVIESFLFDQEQLISRINLLQGHLDIIDAGIAALPSPSEMALLVQSRQGIIRELEGYANHHHEIETAEDWDLRLDSLLRHVDTEIVAVNMAALRTSVDSFFDSF
jgi:hypothetical protein